MNKTMIFEWIRRVMRSCETHIQLNNTTPLINRFCILFPEGDDYIDLLYDEKQNMRRKVSFVSKPEKNSGEKII